MTVESGFSSTSAGCVWAEINEWSTSKKAMAKERLFRRMLMSWVLSYEMRARGVELLDGNRNAASPP